MNSKKLTTVVLAALSLFAPFSVWAADETDIEAIEKQLIQKEQGLLDPEIKLDRLIVDRAKLDGMGGLFQGSKKKELERQIAETETIISGIETQMQALQQQVQEAVFAVASTYEKNGNYKKAIEFYLKVEPRNDAVVARIAGCYKLLKDYQQAISWLLKLYGSDSLSLEIADCYKLDGRMKEAMDWLFRVVEPMNNNAAEITALKLLEELDYPGKKVDFPDFAARLSNAWLGKAILDQPQNLGAAREDYRKAISLIAEGVDQKTVSFGILSRYQNAYQGALDILAQQRDAAERNYQERLNNAQNEYNRLSDRYRRAQNDAQFEYDRQLNQARRELQNAEMEYRRVSTQASPSAQLVEQARQQVEYRRNQYNYVMSRRADIIEDYVRPYRRDMENAMRNYQDIMNRRTQIIEEYIAPFKANVEAAKRECEIIRSLHEMI
ncbi:MAG: hypothetical protein WA705_21020 [Candidatus Ozemobacteraceae bacterium]